jgi:hypothetical protein
MPVLTPRSQREPVGPNVLLSVWEIGLSPIDAPAAVIIRFRVAAYDAAGALGLGELAARETHPGYVPTRVRWIRLDVVRS